MKNWQKNILRWFFKYWMWLFLGLLASVNFLYRFGLRPKEPYRNGQDATASV